MVRRNGPVGTTSRNGGGLLANKHGRWTKSKSSTASTTYKTRIRDMTPNEITRLTIACIASPIGAVGIVHAATSFSSVSIERSLLTPHNGSFLRPSYGTE